MARLFLVRHGETDWNVAGRLQGRRDIPLNSLGRAQSAQVGRVLHQLAGDVAPLTFVSSPLMRAVETMRILRTTLDLPAAGYHLDPHLAELSFGRWEGSTWPELKRRDSLAVRARERAPWTFVPPEGESYEMLCVRASTALDRLKDEDAVVVTHGGVIRALLHTKAGMPQEEAALLPVRQGAVYVLAGGAFRVAE
ncbi:MAG: phosphoglycerate mutase [Rhizobiales bacterium 24-66-13]|jgi:probable phosphoglycerate mutase|nr:MAG: phosphoglycerate mutase [Rhizobiales bacterium 24-66-13]OZB05394.1 MAG: phosphoglycerate mutase [Rhizobiales bacterium 39-66-18]HQS10500.1 histidine phosphatase family protein [Xanthobacteraceae bacterium]HQS49022.1 histidine phosphatase family protein [Xanthobacteraceae bacterium]